MNVQHNKFYKSQGFWWSIGVHIGTLNSYDISGPFCINCILELTFPNDAYERVLDDDNREYSIVREEWVGKMHCGNCGKDYQTPRSREAMSEKVVIDYTLKKRAAAPKESLDDAPTQVKVRDEDDTYFLSAKIGIDKQGRKVGVVYFGQKEKDQKKKDYSQLFVDFENESLRNDPTNKLPQDILARLEIHFQDTTTVSNFKKKK